MSFPAKVQCMAGCGAYGDVELDYLCVECHADRRERQQHQKLQEYIKRSDAAKAGAPASGPESPSRRIPPSIDHHKALSDFLQLPREKDKAIVDRELQFLQREMEIRNTSVAQLRKYMIASDTDEAVDPMEWGRYQYGAPQNVPRHDVDPMTELAAQIRLFCVWRRRTLRRKKEAERQRNETGRVEKRAKSGTMLSRSLPRSPIKRQSIAAVSAAAATTISKATKFKPTRNDDKPKDHRLFKSIWKRGSTSATGTNDPKL